MASVEERLSRIEGGYETWQTKADLAHLRADLAQLEIRLMDAIGKSQWRMTYLLVLGMGATVATPRTTWWSSGASRMNPAARRSTTQ